jgi:hypothetical protein
MSWLILTRGQSTRIRTLRERAVNGASRSQLFAPIVLGMISERTRMASVVTAATTAS